MKPLEGLTILDLSRVLACPFASMILAELGARVIKVEQPGSGDETRTFEPQLARDSAYYFACGPGKNRQRLPGRLLEARRTGVAPHAGRGALFRAERSAAAPGHRAPRPRAFRHVPLQGRQIRAHHGKRPALDAALQGAGN